MTMRLGYIYFTDPDNSTDAIVVVHGEEPKRITDLGALDNSTKWMTNLPNGLPGSVEQNQHSFFFGDKYLRLTHNRIFKQLGADPNEMKDMEKAKIMSQVFCNFILFGEKILGIQRLPRYEYRKGIRRILLPEDCKMPDHILKMVVDATQYYTFSTEKTDSEKRVIFTIPPVEHAKNIFKTSLPAGEWSIISDIPQFPEEIPEWIASRQNPFFARITLSNFNEDLHSLINFGSVTPEESDRQWVTNVELEMLLGKADIDIHEAWESKTTTKIPPAIEQKIASLPDICHLSFSLGLLLENIWSGMALKFPPSHIKKDIETAKAYTNIASPFLRAADRKLCFEKVLALHKKGFTIASYGFGKVIIDSSFQAEEDIIFAALDLDLLPPLCPGINIEPEKEDPYFRKLQAIYAAGKKDLILEIDQAVAEKITTTSNENVQPN